MPFKTVTSSASDGVANPLGELPLRTAKQAALCAELHLGHREIRSLGEDFRFFVNLECLWLNHNSLRDIEGIEDNFRIKELYLHNNSISALPEYALETFVAIRTLTLSNNLLNDLEATLTALKCAKTLQTLELFGNSLSQVDNYRLRVVGELPWLQSFDRHAITSEERTEAKKLLKKLSKLNNFKLQTKKTEKVPEDVRQAQEAEEKYFQEVLRHIRKFVKDNKILVDPSFVIADRRKIGYIHPEEFWRVLHQFGVKDTLSEDEVQLVNKRYLKVAPVVSISKTGILEKGMMDYRQFCFDVVPPNLCKLEKGYTMEVVPEVSVATQELEKLVKTVRNRKRREEEALKRSTLLASQLSQTTAEGTFLSLSARVQRGALDPWLAVELSKKVKATQNNGKLTRDDVKDIILFMEKYGKGLTLSTREALEQLFSNAQSLDASLIATAFGCNFRAKSAAVADRDLVFEWRDLSSEEINKLERRMFSKSQQLFESYIRTVKKEEQDQIRPKLIDNGISAARLQGKQVPVVPTPSVIYPHEVMHSAPNRSDVIVLPNLKRYSNPQIEETKTLMEVDYALATDRSGVSHKQNTSRQQHLLPKMEISTRRTPFYEEIDNIHNGNASDQESRNRLRGSGVIPPKTLSYRKGWNEATSTIVLG